MHYKENDTENRYETTITITPKAALNFTAEMKNFFARNDRVVIQLEADKHGSRKGKSDKYDRRVLHLNIDRYGKLSGQVTIGFNKDKIFIMPE